MRKLALAAMLALPLGGWAVIDHVLDARYEGLCVKHFSDDVSLCTSGYAADAYRRCAVGVRPPGLNRPDGPSGAECVQAWLTFPPPPYTGLVPQQVDVGPPTTR